MSSNEVSVGAGFKVAVVLAAIVFVAGIGAFFIVREAVPEGHVGVVTDRGAATGDVYEAGWHYHNPATKDVEEIETRPRTVTYSGDSAIYVITEDGQDVWVDVTVRYRVASDDAVTFFQEYRTHDQADGRYIEPTVRSDLRDEASDMSARDIITKEGRQSLENTVGEALEGNAEGSGLTFEAVQVRGVELNENFATELENVEIEREKAEQRAIEAEGIAEAERVKAEGDADAMRTRNEAITEQILALEQINAYDSGTVYVTDGDTPIILSGESDGSGMPSVTGDDGPSTNDEPTNESEGDE